MSALEDLRRRWERLRGPRRAPVSERLLQDREAPGRRLALWPERVVVTPREATSAGLPLPPVGRGLPVARLLDGDGRPTGWAAVEPGTGALALPREAGPLWIQLDHDRFRYPAPGAVDLQLGPEGLAGRVLREPYGFELLLVNQGQRGATFRLTPSAAWVDLDDLDVTVPAGECRTLYGCIRSGHMPFPGTTARLEVQAAGHRVGEVVVEVGAWAVTAGLRVQCIPTDLGVVGRAPARLQVHLSAEVPLQGFLHLAVLPTPVVQEFRLEPGVPLQRSFEVPPDSLPRIEHGRLRILAVTDAPRLAERTVVVEVPFRRLKLRRDVPRVRLAPSATNPHPHQAVSMRRSDGGPVRLTWQLSAGLEELVQAQLDREGRLVVWCSAPSPAACDGEIHVLEGETGLQETIPVRVEGRTR